MSTFFNEKPTSSNLQMISTTGFNVDKLLFILNNNTFLSLHFYNIPSFYKTLNSKHLPSLPFFYLQCPELLSNPSFRTKSILPHALPQRIHSKFSLETFMTTMADV